MLNFKKILIGLSLMLTSCVSYNHQTMFIYDSFNIDKNPSDSSDVKTSDESKTDTPDNKTEIVKNDDIGTVIPNMPPSNKIDPIDIPLKCSVFIMPDLGPTPRFTEKEISALVGKDANKINLILEKHIETLYKYSEGIKKKMKDTVDEHLKTCKSN